MRRKRTTLLIITLCLLAGFIAVPVVLTWRQVRQTQINRHLIMAVEALNVSQVRECLSAGADPNEPYALPKPLTLWQSVLYFVWRRQGRVQTRANDRLLAAVLDKATNSSDVAKQHRGSAIAVLLLQFGANPQSDDYSPLWIATWMRAPDVVQALVDRGADVNAVDYYGNLPLVEAAGDTESPTGLLLLAHGANPNVRRARTGLTPLMAAACHGNTALVRSLLAKQADLNAKDVTGKTALAFAREYDRVKIVQLLEQAGARE